MSLKSLRLLQQFRHDARFDMSKAKVYYTDRGAPGDTSVVNGGDIIESGSKFWFRIVGSFDNQEKMIPYHRISRIDYDGKQMFSIVQ